LYQGRGRASPLLKEVSSITINQLEEEGIIRGYHAHVDYEKVGKRMTNLFMCSVPVPERGSKAREILEIPDVEVVSKSQI